VALRTSDRAGKRLTLAAAVLGSAVVFIDQTVVNVALPALQEDLGASLAEQQWVVEAYLLTLASLILVGGSLGDLLGRRRVFVAGVAGFGLASVLCAVAPSAEVLIAARGLQGVAGALLVPSSLAVITATFDPGERGAAIGTWTAGTSAAIAIGPLVGGLLVDTVSWRMVFAINVPVVVACLELTRRGMAELPGPGGRVDVVGGVLAALGLAGPVVALIQQPTQGWGAPEVVAGLVAGGVLLAAFVLWERRHPAPMLPLGIFASRRFAVANAATLAVYAGLGGATFFVALFLQQVGGYSALGAGAALVPVTVLMVTLSRRFGALAERAGPRTLMTAGPIVAGVGLALYGRVDARPDYVTEVLPAVLVFGLGLSMTVAPLTATAMTSAPTGHAGIASGVNNAVARVASLLAIAVIGAVIAAVFTARVGTGGATAGQALRPAAGQEQAAVDAFAAGMGVAGGLVVLGGVVAFAGLRRRVPAPAGRVP
jgi:EmrB/QacA subfamily drug resistance transporter